MAEPKIKLNLSERLKSNKKTLKCALQHEIKTESKINYTTKTTLAQGHLPTVHTPLSANAAAAAVLSHSLPSHVGYAYTPWMCQRTGTPIGYPPRCNRRFAIKDNLHLIYSFVHSFISDNKVHSKKKQKLIDRTDKQTNRQTESETNLQQ